MQVDDTDEDADEEPLVCAAVYLLTGQGECWSCKATTPLFAFMALPPIQGADDAEEPLMLRGLCDMPAALVPVLHEATKDAWREDYSSTAGETYWMNHCTDCGIKQGDHFVHGPDGPFWPNTAAEQDAIRAERIEGPFEFLDLTMSRSSAMFDWWERKEGRAPSEPLLPGRRRRRR